MGHLGRRSGIWHGAEGGVEGCPDTRRKQEEKGGVGEFGLSLDQSLTSLPPPGPGRCLAGMLDGAAFIPLFPFTKKIFLKHLLYTCFLFS